MEVNDGVDQLGRGLLVALQIDPLPQSSDIVAQMRHSGGLDAGEDDARP